MKRYYEKENVIFLLNESIRLPLELYGDIILRAGSVPLLSRISKEICITYRHIIEEYNLIISPITVKEIEQYLLSKPNFICTFDYKDETIHAKEHIYNKEINQESCYFQCNHFLAGSKNFIGGKGKEWRFNESDIIYITNHKICNYDLSTIYQVTLQRTQNNYLAKKVCIDTFNYYCKLLPDYILLKITPSQRAMV